METRQLNPIGDVSSLTLGGGGIGQVWGETDREEAVATTKAAVDGGITLLDMAPSYGRGEAETVIGETFNGSLPQGVRVTSKCQLGTPAIEDIHAKFERSLQRSLAAMKLETVDIFFLHSNICPDEYQYAKFSDNQDRWATRWSTYVEGVIPAMEQLKAQGLIRNWGITGTGVPSTIREALQLDTKPSAVQLVSNLMDGVGNMRLYDSEPVSPRVSMAVAAEHDIGVMGIRAVAAGSLCGAIDRDLPDDEATVVDYATAASFRTLCAEIGEDPAIVAHRYALGMAHVDTVVLGVKNRTELADCLAAADQGPLDSALVQQIDELNILTV
jgi:aryl-alcohol dehydrogenase-like predicted oxidoreductase